MTREYRSLQNLFRSVAPILALLVFSLLTYFTPTNDILLRAVRTISGVVALIFIPGFFIVETFFRGIREIRKFSFSLIFGLAFQTLIILSLHSVGSLFLYDEIDFTLTILVLTFLSTIVLFVLQTRVERRLTNAVDKTSLGRKAKAFVVDNKFLIAVFVLSLAVRLYYHSFFDAPVTDGALYLEMAENIETTGQFTSKVIKDSWSTHFYNALGLSQHPFAIFIISVFFSMSGISLSAAQLMTVFAGALIALVIYEIAGELFGRKTAMIASVIAAIHPLLLLFSCVIYGPEILGTLFVLTAFYFFFKSLRSDLSSSRRYAISAGLFAALTLGTTNYNFWAFSFAIFASLLLVFGKEEMRTRAKIAKILAALFLVGGVILTTYLTPDRYLIHPLPSAFWVLYSAIPIAFVLILYWRRTDRHIASTYWMGIVIFAIYQFVMIRTYYLGLIVPRESIISVTSPVSGLSLPVAILGVVYVQLSNLVTFSGFYGIFWETVVITSTQIIAFLALLSFIRLSKWKENLYMFSFPFFLSVFMTIFGFIPTRITYWTYRLYVATTPFFVILSASTLWLLSKASPITQNPTKKSALKIKGLVFAASLMIIVLFSSFFPIYGEWITPMGEMSERTLYWEPAFEWIKMNTHEDAILMARKPREFAWYTNRATVCPLGVKEKGVFAIREKELIDLILQFEVDYVVVDSLFYADYLYLQYLYDYPSEAPYGFILVFNREDYRGKLLIYDVTSISKPIDVAYLQPQDDAHTYGRYPDANYGNLTKLEVGKGAGLDPITTYLKFYLLGIPKEREILNAKLRLYTKNVIVGGVGGVDSTNLKVFLHYVADDDWNEQNLTYNNQPAFHPEVFTASQLEETYSFREWVTWDVTELVKKEYNEDGVLSLVLEMDYLLYESTKVEFFSKVSFDGPELYIAYS